MPEQEKRIYVVVAQTVQVPDWMEVRSGVHSPIPLRDVIQPCGRNMAQVGHVERKLGQYMGAKDPRAPYVPYTTICLAARDSKEMEHLVCILRLARVEFEIFHDTNPDVYGYDEDGKLLEVLTAIATYPVFPTEVANLTDYLPLWKHDSGVAKCSCNVLVAG